MNKSIQSAIAKYGDSPPRFLWKHLPLADQRRLVLKSIRKELRWLGMPDERIDRLFTEWGVGP